MCIFVFCSLSQLFFPQLSISYRLLQLGRKQEEKRKFVANFLCLGEQGRSRAKERCTFQKRTFLHAKKSNDSHLQRWKYISHFHASHPRRVYIYDGGLSFLIISFSYLLVYSLVLEVMRRVPPVQPLLLPRVRAVAALLVNVELHPALAFLQEKRKHVKSRFFSSL